MLLKLVIKQENNTAKNIDNGNEYKKLYLLREKLIKMM